MKSHKIVKVEWEDSCSYKGWRGKEDAKKFESSTCMSCGILVKVKKGHIGVTHSVGDKSNNDICDTIIIPKKVIKSFEVISTFRR